jgi:hypothetical protein
MEYLEPWPDVDAAHFEMSMHHMSFYRRFFISKEGYIDLPPMLTKVGDSISSLLAAGFHLSSANPQTPESTEL